MNLEPKSLSVLKSTLSPNLILKSIVTSCSCERLFSVLYFKKRILDQKFQKQKLQIILKILVAQDFDANLQEIININQV